VYRCFVVPGGPSYNRRAPQRIVRPGEDAYRVAHKRKCATILELMDLERTGSGFLDATRFLALAEGAREVCVVVAGSSGEVRTPIWIVTAASSVFIRSYRAANGQWYQYAVTHRSFPLEVDGEDVMVRVEPVSEPTTLAKVDAAYRAKYQDEPETPDMLSPAVATTTLKVELLEERAPIAG